MTTYHILYLLVVKYSIQKDFYFDDAVSNDLIASGLLRVGAVISMAENKLELTEAGEKILETLAVTLAKEILNSQSTTPIS